MALTGRQRSYLRGLAHHLDPVVIAGAQGISEALVRKVTEELDNHELIKVKVNEGPTPAKEAAAPLVAGTGAELVQVIGHIVVLYKRRAKDPEIVLPKAGG
ncbi:MAG: ribosome assembly RNA-binding protein YhbY [Alphaproteobacteria bacterium]|nr:ribosome assembly RNA-binding protein YhbY [Alphaproteobacteria bacterium]